MRCTPIEAEDVPEGWERVVIGPPEGMPLDGDVRAAEALRGLMVVNGEVSVAYMTRWMPSEAERERLVAGDPIWVTVLTNELPAHDVCMRA